MGSRLVDDRMCPPRVIGSNSSFGLPRLRNHILEEGSHRLRSVTSLGLKVRGNSLPD